jgi:hypothetical protein
MSTLWTKGSISLEVPLTQGKIAHTLISKKVVLVYKYLASKTA